MIINKFGKGINNRPTYRGEKAMSSELMFDKLDRYYQSQGIPVLGFNCKHRDACSAVCAPGKMVTPMAAYVGPMYEEGILPRLLFVSSDTSDPRWFQGNPEKVTLKATRAFVLNDRLKHCPNPNTHWHQTHAQAQALLAPYAKARLDKDVNINGITEFFAHTHSTRCKDASIGKGEGNPRMYANCCGFLKGEIEVLCPDIIVAQGSRAKNALSNTFPVIRQVSMPGYPSTICKLVQLEASHTAVMIIAKHPCARGRHGWKSGEKKQFMDWAAKSVQEFIPVS